MIFNYINKNNYKYILTSIIITLVLSVYISFVLYGGFAPDDDLQFVALAALEGYDRVSIVGMLQLMQPDYRPLSNYILSIVLVLFNTNYQLYIITNLIVWGIIIITVYNIVAFYLNNRIAVIFALLCSFPYFSSGIISSSYLFIEYGISILFWSLAFLSLKSHIIYQKYYYYILGILMMVGSFLTSPISAPLMIILGLLPIVHEKEISGNKKNIIFLSSKYFGPIIILVVLKYFFDSILSNDVYKIDQVEIKDLLLGSYYYFTILVELPLMLIESIGFIKDPHIAFNGLLIILFYIIIYKYKNIVTGNSSKKHYIKNLEVRFIIILLFSLLSCAILFVFTDKLPVAHNLNNRYLIGPHISLSIILAWLIWKSLYNRLFILSVIISILSVSSTMNQIQNFNNSWEIRKSIYYDLGSKINMLQVGKNPVILANVPFFTENNYNNERVMTPFIWSINSGLGLYGNLSSSNQRVKSQFVSLDNNTKGNELSTINVFPICWRFIDEDKLIIHSDNIQYNYWLRIPINSNLWYYEYNQKNTESTLYKINNMDELIRIKKSIIDNKVNYHPIILREQIRVFLRVWVQNHISGIKTYF